MCNSVCDNLINLMEYLVLLHSKKDIFTYFFKYWISKCEKGLVNSHYQIRCASWF